MNSQYSQEEIQNLINHSAKEANILPITSKCDAKCIFCSHKNNPPDIHTIKIGERSIKEVRSTLTYLNPNNVITIGESASNIIEGEPTLHKNFKEILTMIRGKFPHTPLSITSNGHHLTEDLISFIHLIGNIEMNISLNSASIEGRRKLMKDTQSQTIRTLKGINLLHQYKIPFSCSIVGMPNITGFEDIRDTIDFIIDNGAMCIRIFMPGFSSFVKEDIYPDSKLIYQDLKTFIQNLPVDLPCPVLLEPSLVTDLTATVSGVTYLSPAWNAGIRRNDILLSINDRKPRTRVEAFQLLEISGDITLEVKRNEEVKKINWSNDNSYSHGIIFEYDFDLNRAEYMKHIVMNAQGNVLLLTSEFAFTVIKEVFKLINIPQEKYEIKYVKNLTFGGTIKSAGLLTYQDYIYAYQEHCYSHPEPDVILIPGESFNYIGKDLSGHHVSEIQETLNKRIAIV